MSDSDGMLLAVRREVKRCQRALERGSPPTFWLRRLRNARDKLVKCVRLLDEQITAVEVGEPGEVTR